MTDIERGRRTAVVLGSFKDGAWGSVVGAVHAIKNGGVDVVSPCDIRRTDIAVNGGDFYYLQADLERVGLTEEELKGLSETAIAVKLGILPLQRDVLKNILHMGTNGCVYLTNPFGKIGRSSAYELIIAGLTRHRLAVSHPVEEISPKVLPDARDFLQEKLLPQIPVISLDELRRHSDIAAQFMLPKPAVTPTEAYHLFRISVRSLLGRDS